jgi:hypothetical protein
VPACCCTLAHDPIPASPSGAIWIRGRADRAEEGRSAGLAHVVAGHASGEEQHLRAKMEALSFEKAAPPRSPSMMTHTRVRMTEFTAMDDGYSGVAPPASLPSTGSLAPTAPHYPGTLLLHLIVAAGLINAVAYIALLLCSDVSSRLSPSSDPLLLDQTRFLPLRQLPTSREGPAPWVSIATRADTGHRSHQMLTSMSSQLPPPRRRPRTAAMATRPLSAMRRS